MRMYRSFTARRLACLLVCLFGVPSLAAANTPEDVQGIGARTNAMGGAGTALATDFGATYYAPANLAYCENSGLSIDVRHTHYELETRDTQPGDPEPEELRDQTRLTAGFCNLLPYNFSFGLIFGLGLQNPMTLDQTTLNEKPQFALYGEALEQLTIGLGLGLRIVPEFSLGLGVSILVRSNLVVDVGIPVVDDSDVSASLHWDLGLAASLIVSAHAEPVPGLHFAATYRSALFHDLDAPIDAEIEVAGVFLDVEILLESAAWYSPQSFAIGAAWDPVKTLTVAFDLTWHDWSAHPGPFLIMSPIGDDGVSASLRYPPRENQGFKDIWVPKLGAEYRIRDGHVAFRAGYAFRPSILPPPSGAPNDTQIANLLDANVHSISLGGGYFFGDRPHEFEGEPANPYVRGANGSIDLYVRIHHMTTTHVQRADPTTVLGAYSYGGNVVDIGLQFSLGWF